MRSRRWSKALALFSVALFVGPVLASAETKPAARPALTPVSLPPAPPGCPADMRLDPGKRTVDARRAPSMEWNAYQKMTWAPGHTKPGTATMFKAPAAAIDDLVAAETAHPGMIPAGYRGRVRATPRDPALRLEMARCEVQLGTTRRRAAYDAAAALLLGGDAAGAGQLIAISMNVAGTSRMSCFDGKCDAGLVCDVKQQSCFSPLELQYAYISPIEAHVEDALTRGLVGKLFGAPGPALKDETIAAWAVQMTHSCGTKVCIFQRYGSDSDDAKWVHWDLRDGGSSTEIQNPEAERRNKKCHAGTGFYNRGECLQYCELQAQGAACSTPCIVHCEK